MNYTTYLRAFTGLPVLLLLLTTAQSQTVTSDVLGTGSVAAGNSTYNLTGTVGQAIIGTVHTHGLRTAQGFWQGEFPAVSATPTAIPGESTAILACSPNPVVKTASVTVRSAPETRSTLTLHDLLGRTVLTLSDESTFISATTITFSTEELPEGRYVLRLSGEGKQTTLPIVIVK